MPQNATATHGTALITGASSGIGEELAKIFAAQGFNLVLVARSGDKLAQVAGDLAARHGIRALPVEADLSAFGGPRSVYESVERENLRIDVLVNNAGFGLRGPFSDTDFAAEKRMVELNITALLELTKHFLPGMLARRSGRILNIGSTAGFVPGPFMAVYYATKAFVVSFSQALGNELQGTGVTVTVLCPGPTRTGFSTTAQIEDAALFRRQKVMDAASVARAGYEAVMSGRRLWIPGLQNRWMIRLARLAPSSLLAGITRRLNE